jgi:hypothetical protein
MAETRHRFVPTPRTGASVRTARRRGFPRVLTLTVTAAAAAFLWPLFRAPMPDASRLHFESRRPALDRLKTLLLSEPTVFSVGPDNVREYWLFDGQWTSPKRPGQPLSRDQMLRAVGLSADRYEDYLTLLSVAGAYRAVRGGEGYSRRVVVYLLPAFGQPSARVVFEEEGAATGRAVLGDGWFVEKGAP